MNPFGVQIISDPRLTKYTHDQIDLIPVSRNRSRRVWKKLVQRRRNDARPVHTPQAIQIGGRLIAHPRIIDELRRRAKTQ